jgi:hypothetical protein
MSRSERTAQGIDAGCCAVVKKKKKAKGYGGPFIATAVFCDSILEDSSGKMSAMGISDGCSFVVSHNAPPEVPSKDHPINAMQNVLIMIKSGSSPGKYTLSLTVESPVGKRDEVVRKEVTLSAPPNGGINMRITLGFTVYETGIYWFDVYLDGRRLTRMPLNITIDRLPPPSTTIAAKNSKKR